MLSTHWRTPHTPTEDAWRLLDVLARQAADFIERTLAEAAVRESEERFRLIANTAPVIIWTSGIRGDCTYVNQTALDLTGQSFDAVRGNGWTERIHPHDAARCREIYQDAVAQRKRFQVDFRIRRHDDEYRWLVGTGAPRYHADGSFVGYIGSAVDVTERKRAEEALATVRQRVIDAQHEERARIARELHDDITQRLTLLSIRLDQLADAASASAMVRRDVEEARAEVSGLINDVQGLSHRLHPAPLAAAGIAVAADALCREVSRQQHVNVAFASDHVPGALAEECALCLYRVLQEAVQNAVKHSGAQQVDVLLRGTADRIELSVHDSGKGFDTQALAGCGLGMTSMAERVMALSGQLDVQSSPHHGTTIRAWLPVRQYAGAAADSPERFPPRVPSAQPRVLIADDDAAVRTAIGRFLSPECEVVGHADDCATAFERTMQLRPDIVLLDLSLEGPVDVLDVSRRIKAGAPEVCVVAFTARNDPELRRLATEAGVSAFVWKPRSATDLLPVIRSLLRRDDKLKQ
jgi:PAS domain S-box-containing protein